MAKVLLGFMGAGKSTVARGLDPDFVDMAVVVASYKIPLIINVMKY